LTCLLVAPRISLRHLSHDSTDFTSNFQFQILKKEPNFLGTRTWSQFGKLYLRHFNELDHELEARLNRAYKPAVRYMDSFSSALTTVIAKFVVFTFGGFGAFIAILTVIDEDVIQVEHVLMILTACISVALAAASLIPDENLVFCPEQLMKNILCHAHYLKPEWRGFAHTSKICGEFEDFFQLKAFYFINEIFSPFLTFFVLMFSLRPRSMEIVDFFRNFTVSVTGVGDVCSFAQMEIKKHGNPDWQITNSAEDLSPGSVETNQYTQGENGKTELSLVHFALTNPNWKMGSEAKQFLRGIRKHAIQDLNKARTTLGGGGIGATAMGQSLTSLGEEYSSVVQSILQIQNLSSSQHLSMSMYQQPNYPVQQIPVTPPNTAHPQAQSTTTPTFDFERILQQNLTDGSMTAHLRSQFLPDINEDDDSDDQMHPSMQAVPSNRSAIGMNVSVRGSLAKREGPVEVSRHGLLYSLCNIPQNEAVFSPEFTTADMCLSTLYLHELHHKQQLRRGVRLEASQRHLWQRPHQNQPQAQASQERTPLLSKKT
jgi:autophagy-related protein 9